MSLFKIGLSASVSYCVVILGITFSDLVEIEPLKLNELGDLLAGVFGPVAILWLILGFKQQGDELKEQATQLSASVDQQTTLAIASTEQVKAALAGLELQRRALAAQHAPKFKISNAKHIKTLKQGNFVFDVSNEGEVAHKVEFKFTEGFYRDHSPLTFIAFHSGTQKTVQIAFVTPEDVERARCAILYEDVFGVQYKYLFAFSPMPNSDEFKVNPWDRGEVDMDRFFER